MKAFYRVALQRLSMRVLGAVGLGTALCGCVHIGPPKSVSIPRSTTVKPLVPAGVLQKQTLSRYSMVSPIVETHCAYGQPVAKTVPGKSEYVHRLGYDLLHSAERKTPFWVCERYTRKSLVGNYDRGSVKFEADPELQLAKAEIGDYDDRTAKKLQIGHMAPAASHASSNQTMIDTFYLSNAVPQNVSLNQGRWARIEECARNLTPVAGYTWVISGPAYSADGTARYLGDGVAVPDFVWKIVMLETREGELSSWAVLFPNAKLENEWTSYVVSIDEIEQASGLDFFSEMDDESEVALEGATDVPVCPKDRPWG